MINITLVQLQENLKTITYPASREDMIKNAEEYGADEKILRALKKLPQMQYETIATVNQALHDIAL
jgi:hypothetical protein